ncbi:hypothetical protein GCM10007147_30900 [Nocardiopsis kunsanensis]|uniref:DUF2637 domain-containing protein n=2 Tax=Nocardiopsis kunsanensis TaxID=141693 RepID=A0A919CK04_9ACTN|nr:DUF2637 domain-containing protein [Nocardiopsis kunsanensis]GHD29734.1 hypothetical protein GCM10007147_30900 [Nocardiopsis kunsanensis]
MEPSRWSRAVTIAAVLMLAGIAAVVSYSHMYELALRHGEPEWRAALFPLSVDGMIVGASMALLSDARRGAKGGLLPWALLIIGSAASLAANVAVADPTMWSRIIHAWPSFALIGAYELLMREFRNSAQCVRTAFADDEQDSTRTDETGDSAGSEDQRFAGLQAVVDTDRPQIARAEDLTPFQGRAWRWALDQEREVGVLPTGAQIADCFGRKERWGRLVKERGLRQRQGAAEHEVGAVAERC